MEIYFKGNTKFTFVYEYPYKVKKVVSHDVLGGADINEYIKCLVLDDLEKAYKNNELIDHHNFENYIVEFIQIHLKLKIIHVGIGS